MNYKYLVTLTFCCFILNSQNLSAQTIAMSMVPDSVSSLEVDYNRLFISDDDELGFLSGSYNFQYKGIINSFLNFIGELNYTYKNGENFSGKESGLSNLYLGVQLKTTQTAKTKAGVNLGVYLPTASSSFFGSALSNYYDIFKFVEESTTISGSYNAYHYLDGDLRIGYEIGTDLFLPSDEFSDTELFARYGLSLIYTVNGSTFIQTEFLGIANITTDEFESFDDSSFHTYSVGLGHHFTDKFNLGIYYRNYFDEFFDPSFKGIGGLELNFRL
ncbi:MAG: hypothetical protein HKN51_07010 [Saprospiraceae bacterium]|nr:hypothetical protein [Saprospiraceae bacterium]